jgi:hypothetical protein
VGARTSRPQNRGDRGRDAHAPTLNFELEDALSVNPENEGLRFRRSGLRPHSHRHRQPAIYFLLDPYPIVCGALIYLWSESSFDPFQFPRQLIHHG